MKNHQLITVANTPKVKGNTRYAMEKIGIHDGPHKTESSANNIIPWAESDETFQINMLRILTNISSRITSRRKKTIIIEGNIAAGKTTLTKWLSENKKVQIFPEPIEDWHSLSGFNILEAFYQNPEKWLFQFQTYVILTLVERQLKPTNKPIKVIERSIFAAKHCFLRQHLESGKMNKHEYEIFIKWIEFIEKNHPVKIDEIFYLRTDPETCYERMKHRNRPGESAITPDYLSPHQFYDDWLFEEKSTKVTILNGNNSIEDIRNEFSQKFKY